MQGSVIKGLPYPLTMSRSWPSSSADKSSLATGRGVVQSIKLFRPSRGVSEPPSKWISSCGLLLKGIAPSGGIVINANNSCNLTPGAAGEGGG